MTEPTRSREGKRLSLVVPVHNEAACVEALVREIETHVGPLGMPYEIVFVDDGSRDATCAIIEAMARTKPIRCVSLSRNMGHQIAVACGLELATGDIVVTMDADLQHPPALVPRLVELWEQGYDVVNTSKAGSWGAGSVRTVIARSFYWFFNRISDVQLAPGTADFRLFDRAAVDALVAMPEYFKFVRGQVQYIGFRQTTLPFDVPARFAGTPSYTYGKLLRLASNGLLSFSTFGLRLPLYLGGLALLGALIGPFAWIGAKLLGWTGDVPGWALISWLIVLASGLQLSFLGIFGLYLGNIAIELKRRPLYFVRATLGFDESQGWVGSSRSPQPIVLRPGRARVSGS